MGSKSYLIIQQKSGENSRYYRRVLRKSQLSGFWVLGLEHLDTFWDQNHTRLSVKKVEMFAEGDREGELGGGVLCMCDTFWVQNYNLLSVRKVK